MKRSPRLIAFLARAFYKTTMRRRDTPCYELLKRITPKTLPLP